MSESNATRFRATIEYEGTRFHGSQLQPGVRTVQGDVERALSRLLDAETRVDFAGRTDTGVHALGQEIAFTAPATWSGPDLRRGLTALADDDVAVGTPRPAGDRFHPRFDAERRRYLYLLDVREGGGPFLRRFAWRPIADSGLALPDIESTLETLESLAARLPGERDFAGFAKSGQPERGTRCSVETARWSRFRPDRLVFEIVADRFLHHMVRYLVGTMIETAAGRRPREDFEALLSLEPPARPVFPAPPRGLYLDAVRYAGEWNREGGLPW